MPPTEDEIATLAADAQIHRRLGATLTPPGVSRIAGEALALQLASLGPNPDVTAQRGGLHVGYLAHLPLTTAALFQHVRECCGEVVALRGCEAATRTHLVGGPEAPADGPLISGDVRLTICDAVAHVDADVRATLVRAILSGDVASPTPTTYQTHPLASVVAVGQTLVAGESTPIDARITASLDCCIPVTRTRDHTDGEHAGTTPTVEPVPPAVVDRYLNRVWTTAPPVTTAAKDAWREYDTQYTAQQPDVWRRVGATSQTELIPKVAVALARLQLAESITAGHTTAAIAWCERLMARSVEFDHAIDESTIES